MSFDHKPNNPGEQARIVAAGGSVQGKRVNGDLAVSRAFGDFCYKQAKVVAAKQAVTVDPDFEVHERDNTKDEFLILACDGKMTTHAVVVCSNQYVLMCNVLVVLSLPSYLLTLQVYGMLCRTKNVQVMYVVKCWKDTMIDHEFVKH